MFWFYNKNTNNIDRRDILIGTFNAEMTEEVGQEVTPTKEISFYCSYLHANFIRYFLSVVVNNVLEMLVDFFIPLVFLSANIGGCAMAIEVANRQKN